VGRACKRYLSTILHATVHLSSVKPCGIRIDRLQHVRNPPNGTNESLPTRQGRSAPAREQERTWTTISIQLMESFPLTRRIARASALPGTTRRCSPPGLPWRAGAAVFPACRPASRPCAPRGTPASGASTRPGWTVAVSASTNNSHPGARRTCGIRRRPHQSRRMKPVLQSNRFHNNPTATTATATPGSAAPATKYSTRNKCEFWQTEPEVRLAEAMQGGKCAAVRALQAGANAAARRLWQPKTHLFMGEYLGRCAFRPNRCRPAVMPPGDAARLPADAR